MFGDIGQRLGDNEIGDRLRLVGEPARQMDVEGRRHPEVCGTLHHRRQRRVEATIGQDGRCDAPHHVAQLDERALGVLMRLGDQLLRFRQVIVELGLCQPDGHGQRHQPRLHAVVQVPLDAVPLDLRRGHCALAGIGQGADLVLQRSGRRRRQQPPVDGGVQRRCEDQDGGSRDQCHRGQQPGQR